jgi:hypothetical protein
MGGRDFLSRIDRLQVGAVEEAAREMESIWEEASAQDRGDWLEMDRAFSDFVGLPWNVVEPSSEEELWRLVAVYHFTRALGKVYQLKASGYLAGDLARLRDSLLEGLGAGTLE